MSLWGTSWNSFSNTFDWQLVIPTGAEPVDPRGRVYKHQQSSCAGRDAGQQGAGGREGVGARDAFQESTPSRESGPALAKMKG